MTNQPIVNVFEDEEHMIGALAERIVDMAAACQKRTGRFVAALSGGNTPRPLYEKLASEPFVSRMDWESCFFFLSDERCVDHASSESNYNMIRQCLLQKAPVPEENIFATRFQEEDPVKSAADYQSTIENFFGDSGAVPAFDLILLGIGPDGHTASLFPGTAALDEKDRLVVANFVEKFDAYRITFTLPLINRAEHVFFMVTGHAKSEIVASVLSDESTDYPVRLVGQADSDYAGGAENRELCTITWYLDKGASSLLDLAATPT